MLLLHLLSWLLILTAWACLVYALYRQWREERHKREVLRFWRKQKGQG